MLLNKKERTNELKKEKRERKKRKKERKERKKRRQNERTKERKRRKKGRNKKKKEQYVTLQNCEEFKFRHVQLRKPLNHSKKTYFSS